MTGAPFEGTTPADPSGRVINLGCSAMTESTDSAPEERTVIVIIKSAAHRAWSLFSWTSVLAIFAVGYGAFPALREPVTWPWKAPAEVWGPVVFLGVLIIVWLGFEVKFAVSRRTTTGQLQADVMVSTIMAIVLSIVLGGMINDGALAWWFLVPWIGVIADAIQSGYFGLNNAFQKNPTEILKGE